jgi:hypothetical protein
MNTGSSFATMAGTYPALHDGSAMMDWIGLVATKKKQQIISGTSGDDLPTLQRNGTHLRRYLPLGVGRAAH